jgi:hypothetical protein
MSKIEIVKEMIIKMDGIAEVKMDFINKGFTGIRLIKDDRIFYIGKSEYNSHHIYCDWADAYWLIDYRFYSPEDVIKILETLFLLLPKYDTNSMVSEMKKLAHELYIDTIDFDDDDEWDILVTVLTKNYIGRNELHNDDLNVLYLVVRHSCLNAILNFWPDDRRKTLIIIKGTLQENLEKFKLIQDYKKRQT